EIGRGQRGMAESAHFDHRLPPDQRHRLARAKGAPRDAGRGVLARMLALMLIRNYPSFAPSGKKKARAAPAPGRSVYPRPAGESPPLAALADEGDLGVKASRSRPRSSVG